MPGNDFVIEDDLQMLREGANQTGAIAMGRRHQITVLIEGDKTRFSDRSRHLGAREVRDLGNPLEFLLFQCLDRGLASTPMDTSVSLLSP